MNTQAPEPKAHHLESLDVHSVFLTIQGEGPFTGRPALFIRLAGCNLQCPGCDTDYTSNRKRIQVGELISQAVESSRAAGLIVITGGEPFRQNISPLCGALVELGYTVQIETNGTLPIPASMPRSVHVVCSPKTGSLHHTVECWRNLYLKYVIQDGYVHEVDGLPLLALGHSCKPRLARPPVGYRNPVYIQPMDEGNPEANARNLGAAIATVLANNYCLQLQTHKIIGVA